MRAKLLSALCLLAALSVFPSAAKAQGWADPCGRHLGWLHKHNPPEYCCPPEWRWLIIRGRPYPNSFCQGFKGALTPIDENGLMLPPTSRPGANTQMDTLTPPPMSSSRRPTQMTTDTIKARK